MIYYKVNDRGKGTQQCAPSFLYMLFKNLDGIYKKRKVCGEYEKKICCNIFTYINVFY